MRIFTLSMPFISLLAIAAFSSGKALSHYERSTKESILPETKVLYEELVKRNRETEARQRFELHAARRAKMTRHSNGAVKTAP